MRLGLGLGLHAQSSSAWTPVLLPNKILWLDPGQNIVQASNRVSALNDSSGSGDSNRNAVQATAILRPLYTASDTNFNGQPTISDDDGTRFLATASAWGTTYAQPFGIFVVGNLGDRLCDGSTVGTRTTIVNQTQWAYYAGGSVISGSIAANTRQACCAVYNGASSALYVKDATTPDANGNPGTNSLNNLGIFATSDGAGSGNNDVLAELIIVNGIPSASDIKNFFKYASNKYGVVVTGT